MLSPKRILRSGSFALSGLSPQRLTPWLNALLVAMLAWTLAQLSWRLMPLDEGAVASGYLTSGAELSAAPAGRKGSAPGLDEVAALHLFGDATEAPPEVEQAPITAPETRLNLTLKGVVALDTQEGALAIIAKGGSDEQAYGIGESVPGGATLHEIHPDRVILQRNGRFETLTLPKERMADGAAAPSPAMPVQPRPSGARRSSAPAQRLGELRESLRNNPQEAMQLINPQPVMDGGQLKGYRVNPGRDRRLFSSVGLRPGDIVTSVNGIPLNDPSQMAKLMGQLSTADRLNVTVERRGQQSQLSVDLK